MAKISNKMSGNEFPWKFVLFMVLVLSVLLNWILLSFYFNLDEECLELKGTIYTVTIDTTDEENGRKSFEEANFTSKDDAGSYIYGEITGKCEFLTMHGYVAVEVQGYTYYCNNGSKHYTFNIKAVEPVCMKTAYIYKGD